MAYHRLHDFCFRAEIICLVSHLASMILSHSSSSTNICQAVWVNNQQYDDTKVYFGLHQTLPSSPRCSCLLIWDLLPQCFPPWRWRHQDPQIRLSPGEPTQTLAKSTWYKGAGPSENSLVAGGVSFSRATNCSSQSKLCCPLVASAHARVPGP